MGVVGYFLGMGSLDAQIMTRLVSTEPHEDWLNLDHNSEFVAEVVADLRSGYSARLREAMP
jgi:hypothetical protein